jgi:hypothetical protein
MSRTVAAVRQQANGCDMSWMQKLDRAKAELAERDADPVREKLEGIVRGMEAISTASLLDLIGLPPTTGNARRISGTMQSLGFVPIKSRRFLPGGWRSTVARGWARPIRENRPPSSTQPPALLVRTNQE